MPTRLVEIKPLGTGWDWTMMAALIALIPAGVLWLGFQHAGRSLQDLTEAEGRVPGRGVRVATVPRGNLRFLDDLRQPKEGHDDRRQDGAARAA